MSHELSITVEADGKYFLIPTVVNGKKLKPEEAAREFQQRRIKPLMGPFTSKEEAKKAAERRSDKGTGLMEEPMKDQWWMGQ